VRDRQNEVLFMDLRKIGHVYDKKYIEFTYEDQKTIANIYHNWKSINAKDLYKNVKDFCYSATKQEIQDNDYVLMPSKYIEMETSIVDVDFDAEIKTISTDLASLYTEESLSRQAVLDVLKELGYEHQ
jgi:type I restriction enzyme M protein